MNIKRFIWHTINRLELEILWLYKPYDKDLIRLFREIWKEEPKTVLFSPHELFAIYSICRNQRKLGGDFAEVGVYNGASAKVICSAKHTNTQFFIFDSFDGLPKRSEQDGYLYEKGMFKGQKDFVKKRLQSYANIHLIDGIFPKSIDIVKNKKFSFVHIDVDLYKTTLKSLELFFPRLIPRGIMLIHDYSHSPGVRKAVDEFLNKNANYQFFELPVSQAMIVRD